MQNNSEREIIESLDKLSVETNEIKHVKSKDKKKKKPKPGSKAAQLLKSKTDKSFTKPSAHIFDDILILYFSSSSDLKLALMNVHIYYEKQELKGPLKGVNFPISVYNEWSSNITEFNEGEQLIHSIITSNKTKYLIAGLKGDQSTFLHEWAHAVYYSKDEYRELISKIYSGLDPALRQVIEKELLLRNYQPSVFEDEFQAYVRENPADFGKKYTSYLSDIHQQLKKHVEFPKLSIPLDL